MSGGFKRHPHNQWFYIQDVESELRCFEGFLDSFGKQNEFILVLEAKNVVTNTNDSGSVRWDLTWEPEGCWFKTCLVRYNTAEVPLGKAPTPYSAPWHL